MASRKTAARAEKLPSVSAIINRFKESGALIGWAWKMGKEGRDLRAARELTIGVLVEQCIEDYLLGTSRPFPVGTTPADVEKSTRCFDGFKAWATEHHVELVERQVELTSAQHRFVGRIDAVIRIDSDLATADWKVTNGVYLDHLLQLAAYRILLRERDGDAAPKRSALIQIGKDDGAVHPHEWPSDTLDMAERLFLTLRAAWDLDRALKPAINPAA